MPGVFRDIPSLAEDIDMDRVVADPEYRASVITRLRRERLLKAQPFQDEEAPADED